MRQAPRLVPLDQRQCLVEASKDVRRSDVGTRVLDETGTPRTEGIRSLPL
jgi:hypothetical protein